MIKASYYSMPQEDKQKIKKHMEEHMKEYMKEYKKKKETSTIEVVSFVFSRIV